MSDKYTTLFGIDASFVQGEQPTHTKLTNIVALTRNGLSELEKVIGMTRNSLLVESTGNTSWVPVPAKDSFNTGVLPILRLDSPSHIVSLARAIGPMSGLNPRYLSSQTWNKANFSAGSVGILLKDGVTEQQLPFKPLDVSTILPSDFSGPDVSFIFQTRVTSYDSSLEVGKYYITTEGRLFTGAPVRSGTRLKYSFRIGEGDGYIGSGYNVIPDPSILTFSLVERDSKTFASPDYGACNVSVYSVTEEALVVNISLPEVISTPFSKLSRSHEVEDLDPVGALDIDSGLKRYKLPGNYESSGLLEDNTLYLYYTETGKVIPEAKFERISEFVIRAYLPARYKTIVRADNEELLNTVGLSNTKHFFLITNGTQLAPLVGKLRLEMEEHSHNGLDSVRVSHNDLADVNHILPTLPAVLNIYANVDGVIPERNIEIGQSFFTTTSWFNRKLSNGNFLEENPHPYYLHRLGYFGGGTDGVYAITGPRVLGASLANGFTGDLVLMPVTSSESIDEGGYTWESTNEVDYTINNSASHSLWFGLPWEVKAFSAADAINDRQRNGSVRMYFDPWIRVMGSSSGLYGTLTEPFSTEGLGILNTGTIGADVFNNSGIQNAIKGLNLQRGNFFFGYNEHKFLGTTERNKGKSSFNVLASEFNAVVTANEKATQSGEVRWKGQSGNRSGFSVKAIEGSSVNFSIGGLTGTPGTPVNPASLSAASIVGSQYNLAGSFTVEAAFGNQLISTTQAHGAGILMSPGTGTRKLFPWQLKSPLIGNLEFTSPTKYAGWNHLEQVANNFMFASAQNLGGVSHIFSILDTEAIKNLLTFAKDVDLTESVKNQNSFPFGKLILEGSSGIDLLVSRGTYSPRNVGILNVLDLSEVRFWGREDLRKDINQGIRNNHAAGANLNLMYGYGKAYSRFGVNLPWDGTEENIKGSRVQNPGTEGEASGWSGLRTQSLEGLVNADTKGSQIRQASFIEAMEGFRSDPNQPFTVTYRLPFRVIQRLDWIDNGYTTGSGVTISSWYDFTRALVAMNGSVTGSAWPVFIPSAIIGTVPVAKTRVISENIEQYPGSYGQTVNPAIRVSSYINQPSIGSGRFVFDRANTPIDELGYGIFVDQIIRYYDFQDWANREYQGNFVPGSSLIDFKVDLNYSKLVYGDSDSELYGQQFDYTQTADTAIEDRIDINNFFSENQDELISYISGKHYSVISGVQSTEPGRDEGLVIRSSGSTSNLNFLNSSLPPSSIEPLGYLATSTQEPYKASLVLGPVKINENASYIGNDSIGEESWMAYINNIKNNIDSNIEEKIAEYSGEKYTGEISELPHLAWFIQIEAESKQKSYALHRFAPYELFMSSNGKEHGLGPGQKLMLAFDGYVNLTFRTLGGSPPAKSGVVTQTS